MPEPDAPGSDDAALWRAACARACDRIAQAVSRLTPAQRAEQIGAGAGGDTTLRVDRVAEDLIIEELTATGVPFLLVSEELGECRINGGGPTRVVVDPIDGSLNASRGMPAFATSIAVADGATMGSVWLGVVRDHGTGQHHVAQRGHGAHTDGRRVIAPSGTGALDILLLEGASPSRVCAVAGPLGDRVARLRAVGSLALSLCHVAAGHGDAMAGLGPGRAIDVAAAQLFAREAGLLVGTPEVDDLDHFPLDLATRRYILAAGDHATLDLLRGAVVGAGLA